MLVSRRPGVYASQCFLTARCEHLCSTQRGLLVHVGRPHERGALRGERAVDRLDERAVEPGASDAAVVRYLVTAVALVV